MTLSGILPFARELLKKCIPAGGVAVDATAGNGHDTVFLAELTGENGMVYSFDIQKSAIEATEKRLKEKVSAKQVTLIQSGHETVHEHLAAEHHNRIDGAIFNLGYLPGSDKTVVTVPETTIQAVKQLSEHTRPGGLIVIVVYHGHEKGREEKDELLGFVRSMPQETFHVLEYTFTNQRNNPPFIIAIEKKTKNSI